MTEFITRFSEADKWFIDGMTNQFLGLISDDDKDAEWSDVSTTSLFHMISLYMELRSQLRIKSWILQRWTQDPRGDGIFQDIYDEIFEDYNDFFVELAKYN
jgi:hypothetical protein